MSRLYNAKISTNNNNNNNNNKPFCKVCADAGKTDTAHFVRATPDPKSHVVCPTLLALECRYCFKNGHTVKYCTVLKRNEADKMREQRRTTKPTTTTTTTNKPGPVNKFALLDEDNEQDDEEDNQTQLSNNTNNNNNNNNNTWAAIATIAATKIQPVYKPSTITTIAQILIESDDDNDNDNDNEIDESTYVQPASNYTQHVSNYTQHVNYSDTPYVQPAYTYFNTTPAAADYDGDEW